MHSMLDPSPDTPTPYRPSETDLHVLYSCAAHKALTASTVWAGMGATIAAHLGSAILTAKTGEDGHQMLPSVVRWALAVRSVSRQLADAHDRTRATWIVSQSQAEDCVTAGSTW